MGERLSEGPTPVSLETVDGERLSLAPSVLQDMPYMSVLGLSENLGPGEGNGSQAVVLCAGSTGEDGFEILAPPNGILNRLSEALLAQVPVVRPAGVFCLDL